MAKTGEKIGTPRWEYAIGSAMLSKLKYHLLEKIERDEVEFEGRFHQVNPIKVRLLAYIKDWGRAEELPEPSEFMNDDGEAEDETVESKYGNVKCLRVGVLHSSISKSQKALKLNVE